MRRHRVLALLALLLAAQLVLVVDSWAAIQRVEMRVEGMT